MKLDFLFREVTPKSWNKYIVVWSGAVVGGVAFGLSAMWSAAIFWDIVTVFLVWLILKIARAI